MKPEHIAVVSNSEVESDKFFIELLGLKKTRSFNVSADLMENFFGVKEDHHFFRYENENLSFEVVITNIEKKRKDFFTHVCLLVENKEAFINKASALGFETIKVPRKNGEGFYYFVQDSYENCYEIK